MNEGKTNLMKTYKTENIEKKILKRFQFTLDFIYL